jgi:hypothetical protein
MTDDTRNDWIREHLNEVRKRRNEDFINAPNSYFLLMRPLIYNFLLSNVLSTEGQRRSELINLLKLPKSLISTSGKEFPDEIWECLEFCPHCLRSYDYHDDTCCMPGRIVDSNVMINGDFVGEYGLFLHNEINNEDLSKLLKNLQNQQFKNNHMFSVHRCQPSEGRSRISNDLITFMTPLYEERDKLLQQCINDIKIKMN